MKLLVLTVIGSILKNNIYILCITFKTFRSSNKRYSRIYKLQNYCFKIDKKQVLENYYVQDFDLHHSIYRSSNFGSYSNQFSEHDTTIVMAEIPFSLNDKH